MSFEVDIGDKTVDDIEKEAGALPIGYYFAMLEDEEQREDGDIWLHFKTSRGEFIGRKLTLYLKNPDMLEGDKQVKAKQRAAVYAKRMGAVAPGAKGNVTIDFGKCVGQEFIVRVIHDKYEGRTQSRIEYFAGVYPATGHDDIPNDARPALGLALRPEEDKGKGKGKAKKDENTGTAGQSAGAKAADKVW